MTTTAQADHEHPRLTTQQQQKLDQCGEWVIQTCLMFGATSGTAYRCAAEFVDGIAAEWLKQTQPPQS